MKCITNPRPTTEPGTHLGTLTSINCNSIRKESEAWGGLVWFSRFFFFFFLFAFINRQQHDGVSCAVDITQAYLRSGTYSIYTYQVVIRLYILIFYVYLVPCINFTLKLNITGVCILADDDWWWILNVFQYLSTQYSIMLNNRWWSLSPYQSINFLLLFVINLFDDLVCPHGHLLESWNNIHTHIYIYIH